MNDSTKADTEDLSLAGLVNKQPATNKLAEQETLHAPTSNSDHEQSFKPAETLDRMTILPRILESDHTSAPALNRAERLRYKLKRGLGTGAMGIVELARDQDIGRHVAVKKLKYSSDPKAVARMVDEVRIVGQLEHPNIVPIHDVGLTANGDYYFVMRYVDGLTLRDIIDGLKNGDAALHARFPFPERIRIFRDLLNAMAYAHAHGVIHRDLKPENIMVGHNDEVFVMDWGIAESTHEGEFADDFNAKIQRAAAMSSQVELKRQSPSSSRAPSDLIQGTPMYMGPEQVQGIDHKQNDVYTLGVILHEFLCLHHYLDDKRDLVATLQGVMLKPVPPAFQYRSAHQGRVPIEWSHFVSAAVKKDPHARFVCARQMLVAFNQVDDGRFKIQCPTSLTKRTLTALVHLVDAYPSGAYAFLLAVMVFSIYQIAQFVMATV